jgi:hypothetical protein
MANTKPPTLPFNTRLPAELIDQIRAMSARTGISATRIIADGVRRRLAELEESWSEEPPPEASAPRRPRKHASNR